jgi:hypothetical protein
MLKAANSFHCLSLSVLLSFFTTVAVCAPKSAYPKQYRGTPYEDVRYQGGPQKILGRVECAYYDRGGEGVAYHDSDAKNNGSGALNPPDGTYLNQFRMDEGVDISYTKFHDQIDIAHPTWSFHPRTNSTSDGPSPESGSTSMCRSTTPASMRPIFSTPQIEAEPK